MRIVPFLCVLCASVGCRTVETPVPSTVAPLVRVGQRVRTWEVRCNGEALGLVVLFQEHGHARDSVYVVRNPWHQDLGLIDGLGRAYRYLPHHEEPAWVGSGTIGAGAQRILGASDACELVELDPDELDGSALSATPRSLSAGGAEAAPRPADAALPDGGLPQSR